MSSHTIEYKIHEVRPASLLLARVVDFESYGSTSTCISALGIPKKVAGKLKGTPKNAPVTLTIRLEEPMKQFIVRVRHKNLTGHITVYLTRVGTWSPNRNDADLFNSEKKAKKQLAYYDEVDTTFNAEGAKVVRLRKKPSKWQQAVEEIAAALWPRGNLDASWSPDTLEAVALIVRRTIPMNPLKGHDMTIIGIDEAKGVSQNVFSRVGKSNGLKT